MKPLDHLEGGHSDQAWASGSGQPLTQECLGSCHWAGGGPGPAVHVLAQMPSPSRDTSSSSSSSCPKEAPAPPLSLKSQILFPEGNQARELPGSSIQHLPTRPQTSLPCDSDSRRYLGGPRSSSGILGVLAGDKEAHMAKSNNCIGAGHLCRSTLWRWGPWSGNTHTWDHLDTRPVGPVGLGDQRAQECRHPRTPTAAC